MHIYKNLIGYKIVGVSRTLDLIMLTFEDNRGMKFYLHIQCFFRMFRNKQLILSSWDLYRPHPEKSEVKFLWTEPGSSLFDFCLDHSRQGIYGLCVKDVVQKKRDLLISLSDYSNIEILIDTTSTDEQYRIFDDSNANHFVVPLEE
jgi:hypothetical protein